MCKCHNRGHKTKKYVKTTNKKGENNETKILQKKSRRYDRLLLPR